MPYDAERLSRLLEVRFVSPTEALKTALAVKYPHEEIVVEYVGDLTYHVTVPLCLDPHEVWLKVKDVMPVTIRVEVRHP